MPIKFTTAGASHGPALVSILEGMPAGLPLLAADVNAGLARRQQGYGRGRRMQIEKDTVEFLSGVRAGQTLGSPMGMKIDNRDWKNWMESMDPAPREGDPDPRKRAVTRVRPGHADLTGILAMIATTHATFSAGISARPRHALRVGGLPKVPAEFGVRIGSHLNSWAASMPPNRRLCRDPMPQPTRRSPHARRSRRAADDHHIDEIKRAGNTPGGIWEWSSTAFPSDSGSHVSGSQVDGRIGAAILSILAVKGVEIGMGFQAARVTGRTFTMIEMARGRVRAGNVRRKTNRAGGLEGGDDHGRATRRARRHEANQHSCVLWVRWTWPRVKPHRRPPSERRDCGAGHGRDRRGDAGDRPRGCISGEVRRCGRGDRGIMTPTFAARIRFGGRSVDRTSSSSAFRGGKTTVGQAVAKRPDAPSTSTQIERREGRSISQIFGEKGEAISGRRRKSRGADLIGT